MFLNWSSFTHFASPWCDGSTGEVGFPIRAFPMVLRLILSKPIEPYIFWIPSTRRIHWWNRFPHTSSFHGTTADSSLQSARGFQTNRALQILNPLDATDPRVKSVSPYECFPWCYGWFFRNRSSLTYFESPRRGGSTGEIGFPIRALYTVLQLILLYRVLGVSKPIEPYIFWIPSTRRIHRWNRFPHTSSFHVHSLE